MPFLQAVAECRIADLQVNALFTIIDRYSKQQHFMAHVDFSIEHPVEEVGRLLTAVLIKHLYLGSIVLSLIEKELRNEPIDEIPKQLCDVIKTVHNAKWNLIKIRQEKNCSYKEVCTPMLDRCRFLLHDVRAATSYEIKALRRLQLLYTTPRWKRTVKKLIADFRAGKSAPTSKPEDILNASIQSQGGDVKKKQKIDEEHEEVATSVQEDDDVQKELDNQSESQIINNLLILSEKNHPISLNEDSMSMANSVVDFVTQEDCPNIEVLRKAMYSQIERAEIRLKGLEMISELFRKSNLIASVKYSLLNGWLGVCHKKQIMSIKSDHCLDNIQLVTPYYKMEVMLSQAKVSSWAVDTLRQFVVFSDNNCRKGSGVTEKLAMKESVVGWTKRLPWTRFVLGLIAVLTKSYKGNEISCVINSGALSLLQILLRQIAQKPVLEQKKDDKAKEEYAIYEDTAEKAKPAPSSISGPELASRLKIGKVWEIF